MPGKLVGCHAWRSNSSSAGTLAEYARAWPDNRGIGASGACERRMARRRIREWSGTRRIACRIDPAAISSSAGIRRHEAPECRQCMQPVSRGSTPARKNYLARPNCSHRARLVLDVPEQCCGVCLPNSRAEHRHVVVHQHRPKGHEMAGTLRDPPSARPRPRKDRRKGRKGREVRILGNSGLSDDGAKWRKAAESDGEFFWGLMAVAKYGGSRKPQKPQKPLQCPLREGRRTESPRMRCRDSRTIAAAPPHRNPPARRPACGARRRRSPCRCRAGWSAAGRGRRRRRRSESPNGPLRISTMSARLPGVSEPIRSSRPSTRAAPMVAVSISRRGVSSGMPGRTGGRRPTHGREAALHRAVEEALDVEHHAQLAQRVGRDRTGDVAAEHHVDAAIDGAAHDIGRRALRVGGRREAERHAGPRHQLELGIGDQVAVDHQKSGPSRPAAFSRSIVPVSLTWMQLGALSVAREGELLFEIPARRSNRCRSRWW